MHSGNLSLSLTLSLPFSPPPFTPHPIDPREYHLQFRLSLPFHSSSSSSYSFFPARHRATCWPGPWLADLLPHFFFFFLFLFFLCVLFSSTPPPSSRGVDPHARTQRARTSAFLPLFCPSLGLSLFGFHPLSLSVARHRYCASVESARHPAQKATKEVQVERIIGRGRGRPNCRANVDCFQQLTSGELFHCSLSFFSFFSFFTFLDFLILFSSAQPHNSPFPSLAPSPTHTNLAPSPLPPRPQSEPVTRFPESSSAIVIPPHPVSHPILPFPLPTRPTQSSFRHELIIQPSLGHPTFNHPSLT
ncbi:hypothetical protein IE53DRAFT_235191 [Violaceomyces palustris]|uniref:Uncharacterized protein n=1 Tax=Violaceomyces palustris TaxID=1673888 RepID=A0ACD0P4B5_9BASI|nr:hypothetical protein IE53DRAFT_235191 [Violaceomyces palustris]